MEKKVKTTLDSISKLPAKAQQASRNYKVCLLYTSDAADERSSVDLGGRRIIKKNNLDKQESTYSNHIYTKTDKYTPKYSIHHHN